MQLRRNRSLSDIDTRLFFMPDGRKYTANWFVSNVFSSVSWDVLEKDNTIQPKCLNATVLQAMQPAAFEFRVYSETNRGLERNVVL